MNTCTRMFAAMVLVALALPGFAQSFVLKSADGGFAVTFPARPEQKTQPQQGGTLHLYVLNSGGGAWVASYYDLPKEKRSGGTAALLEEWAKGAARDGRLRKSSRVKVAGASGREVLVDLDGDKVRRQRGLIVKDRLYQIAYAGPRGTDASAEVKRFFDSFKLRR